MNDFNISGDLQQAPTISENELFDSLDNSIPDNTIFQEQPTVTTTTTITQPLQSTDLNIGSFLSAELAVEILDTVAAAGGVIALQAVGVKATKSSLSASQKEKAMLQIPMEQALSTFNVKVTNPLEALMYAVLAAYGSKMAIIYATSKMIDSPEIRETNAPEKAKKRRHTGKADCKCEQCSNNG
jgi:hypothetical protein